MDAILSYPARWAIYLSGITLASLYVHLIVRPLKTFQARILASIPIFSANIILPLLFSAKKYEVIDSVLSWGMCLWLGNFRLVSFCFGRGRLAEPSIGKSFRSFLIALYFPLRVRAAEAASSSTPQQNDSISSSESDSSLPNNSDKTRPLSLPLLRDARGRETSSLNSPPASQPGVLFWSSLVAQSSKRFLLIS